MKPALPPIRLVWCVITPYLNCPSYLFICFGIMRNSGTVRVESAPGEGSTFFFTLPAGGAATG